MPKTIVDAIREVMKSEGRPMTISEIYDAIISEKLYSFKADKPVHVVQSQIRRHCKGLDFPSASATKYFEIVQDGKYSLLKRAEKVIASDRGTRRKGGLTHIKLLHSQHVEAFKSRVLDQLRKLEPASFERFCKNLLTEYGFRDVMVTGRPGMVGLMVTDS